MSLKISASLLSDPDLADTVYNLQRIISRKYLPRLGNGKRNKAEYAPDVVFLNTRQITNQS